MTRQALDSWLTLVRAAPGSDGSPINREQLAETYGLIGVGEPLASNMNHRVQVIGTVLPTEAATETSSTKAAARVPLLRVEMVKSLSSSCVDAPGRSPAPPSR